MNDYRDKLRVAADAYLRATESYENKTEAIMAEVMRELDQRRSSEAMLIEKTLDLTERLAELEANCNSSRVTELEAKLADWQNWWSETMRPHVLDLREAAMRFEAAVIDNLRPMLNRSPSVSEFPVGGIASDKNEKTK